jgi:hypothetical protein
MRRLGVPAARALAGAAAAAMLLALPGSVFAVTNVPIAQTGGMTVTMPIMTTGLTVTVNLDTATGDITSTTVSDPSLAQATSSSSFVKFANSGSTEKVTVKAMGSKLAISAKVTTLAELVGTGTWSASVFGTGGTTTATYTIGDDGNGNPTVSMGTPSGGPSGMTWTAATAKSGSGDGEAYASAGGTFSYQGFKKTLDISVKVDTEDGYARLSVILVGRDVQVTTGTLSDLAGAGQRSWSGIACDGTALSVLYHVDATGSGSVVFDSATGGTTTQKTLGNGALMVRFDKAKAAVLISLKDDGDGTYTLTARGFSGFCMKPDEHQTKSGQHRTKSGDQQTKTGDQQDSRSSTGWLSAYQDGSGGGYLGGYGGGSQGGFGGGDH